MMTKDERAFEQVKMRERWANRPEQITTRQIKARLIGTCCPTGASASYTRCTP